MTAAKKIDSKGRLLLGEDFAGKFVLVEMRANGEFVVKPAAVIPVSEQWLYDNKEAHALVKKGLQEAKAGKLVANDDFEEGSALLKKIE